MATPQARTRTNYFAVNDKLAFSQMVNILITGDDDKARLMENSQGEVGFCCNDYVYGLRASTDPDASYDAMETAMVQRIQQLIEPGHACIISCISWENLRTVESFALVITRDDVKTLDMNNLSLDTARAMLSDDKYSPGMVC